MAKLLVWHAHNHSSLWSVTQTGGLEGGGAASVPKLNDSLGQPLLHMLPGERGRRTGKPGLTGGGGGDRGWIKRGKTEKRRVSKLSYSLDEKKDFTWKILQQSSDS